MINIIPISKNEAVILNKKGYRFHEDIMPTYTRYRHYWLVETEEALNDLENLRKFQEKDLKGEQ